MEKLKTFTVNKAMKITTKQKILTWIGSVSFSLVMILQVMGWFNSGFSDGVVYFLVLIILFASFIWLIMTLK